MGSKAIVQKACLVTSRNDQRNLFYEGYNRVWYVIIGVSLILRKGNLRR